MKPIRPFALSVAIALGLSLAGAVIAQSKAPTAAQQQELDAARVELEQAAKRMAELSSKYHAPEATWVMKDKLFEPKPVIGVLLAPDPQKGVRITGITPDSAAGDAGIRSGDRLLAVDGKDILGSNGELRVDNARMLLSAKDTKTPIRLAYERDGRRSTVSVTPRMSARALVFRGDDSLLEMIRNGGASPYEMLQNVVVDIDQDDIDKQMGAAMKLMSAELPRINREVIRIVDCKDKDGDCGFPMLTEAFRWSGLNLASLDPQLGRYFGTDKGVLVLSTGGELAGLQPGDVVQKIDGKAVDSPREAMAALRAKPAESRVRVDYLRDRKPATAQVTVPKATPFRVPPAPPAPPPPPAPDAPTPPAAPAAPDAPKVVEKRKVVIVDESGKTRTWEGGAGDPMPDWVPKDTSDGKRVERRKIVKIDEDGKTLTWEGDADEPLPEWADDVPPPPPPPAPPAAPPPPPAPDGD